MGVRCVSINSGLQANLTQYTDEVKYYLSTYCAFFVYFAMDFLANTKKNKGFREIFSMRI